MAVIGRRRQVGGLVGGGPRASGPELSFGLIHPRPGPFTGVRGPHIRAGPDLADGGERWCAVILAVPGARKGQPLA